MKTEKQVEKIESALRKIVKGFKVEGSIQRTVQYQLDAKLSDIFADIFYLIEQTE